jgi:hypothetical protein
MEKYKTVTVDGVKYFEKSFKKVIPVSDYGIVQTKGAALSAEANLKIGFNVEAEKNYTILKGYLNDKLIPGTNDPAKDSYNDIPTGSKVYDIGRLVNNPVALVNHDNNAAGIAGNYIYLSENEQGLQFKLVLRPIESIHSPITKDAVQAWSDGFGKAFSIGGRFYYDQENSKPEQDEYILVKAILHEASLVGIGADQWALSVAPETGHVAEQGKNASCGTLEYAVSKFLESEDDSELVKMVKI